eukprot:jgi/Psemu1/52201/gm1.52201_g
MERGTNGVGCYASTDITTKYIKPNQQAVNTAVHAKHSSPSNICTPLAPAPPPVPPPPVEESPVPTPFLDESPLLLSIQCSFEDCSKDLFSSFAAGALGLMTQKLEAPKESPPAFSSIISFTTLEETTPIHMSFTDRTNHHEDRITINLSSCYLYYKDHNQFKQLQFEQPRVQSSRLCASLMPAAADVFPLYQYLLLLLEAVPTLAERAAQGVLDISPMEVYSCSAHGKVYFEPTDPEVQLTAVEHPLHQPQAPPSPPSNVPAWM